MTSARVRALLAPGVAAVVMLAGCGGGGDESTSTRAATPTSANVGLPPAVTEQANANCRAMVHEVRGLASGVIDRYHSAFPSLTAIVSRSIPILERFARRQRALQAEADSQAYDRYLQSFDPAIVLLQERLRAGQAQDVAEARRLNGLIAGLSVEQKNAAREAGLADCDVDFRSIVTQAAFGAHG